MKVEEEGSRMSWTDTTLMEWKQFVKINLRRSGIKFTDGENGNISKQTTLVNEATNNGILTISDIVQPILVQSTRNSIPLIFEKNSSISDSKEDKVCINVCRYLFIILFLQSRVHPKMPTRSSTLWCDNQRKEDKLDILKTTTIV